ncbi:MAG: DUF3098 domain-containing protein [Bacteroidia bacterium]
MSQKKAIKKTVKPMDKVRPGPGPQQSPEHLGFAFGRQNYILLAIGFIIIIIGFTLMAGTEDIYSFRKVTLAPIVVIFGFCFEIYAILKKVDD